MLWHQTGRRLTSWALISVVAAAAFAAVATATPTHAGGPYVVNSTADVHDADPTDGACDTGNVVSGGQPECTLRAAVEQANADGVFTVVQVPTGNHVLSLGEIAIETDLHLIGFRDVVIDGNDQDRIFNIDDPVSVTIENVTMQRGLGGNGGAIRNRHGDLTLVDVVLQDNRALGPGSPNKGGAIWNTATLALINSHLEANEALGAGGAIWSSGTVILDGTSVLRNMGQTGGGLVNNGGEAWIVDSVVSENRATGVAGYGGGIANTTGAEMRIESSYVSLNISEPYEGGGIRNMGVLSVRDTTISFNDAALSGGGVYNTGAFDAEYSTLHRNDAGGVGGAVALSNAAGTIPSMTATNVTFSGNRAVSGGAIATQRGGTVVALLHVTIADNRTDEDGAAIYAATDSIVRYRNTILAAASGAAVCGGNASALISDGHNLATDSTCNLTAPGDQPATNPMLDPLGSNGGATQTHALQPASPAVDAALTVSPPIFRDQRHFARFGSPPDVGAYEIAMTITIEVNDHWEMDLKGLLSDSAGHEEAARSQSGTEDLQEKTRHEAGPDAEADGDGDIVLLSPDLDDIIIEDDPGSDDGTDKVDCPSGQHGPELTHPDC